MKEYIKDLIERIEVEKAKVENKGKMINADYIQNEYFGYAEKNNLEKSWKEYERFYNIYLKEGGLINF